jgi:DNA-binding LacI/PurR family transcriptional regulator
MTLEDVANIAGVSKSTVHRFITKSGSVSPRAAGAIKKAMDESGYVKKSVLKRFANNLAKGQVVGNIGALFYDTRKNSPLAARLMYGFEVASADNNFNVIVSQFDGSGALPGSITRGEVDGLIVRPGDHAKLIGTKLPSELPSVWLFETQEDRLPEHADSVVPDDEAVGQMALKSLMERDCQDIAIINPWPNHPATTNRNQAFVNLALKKDVNVFTSQNDGCDNILIDRILKLDKLPDGLFVNGNCAEVLWAYQTLLRKGVEPGKDLMFACCVPNIELFETMGG